MAERTTVDIKPAAESKINWTQIAGILASVAAIFGLNVDPGTLVTIIVGIQTLVGVVTIIFKTFFTGTITPSSAGMN